MKKKSNRKQKELSTQKTFIYYLILIFLIIFAVFLFAETFIRSTRPYADLRVLTGLKTGKNPKETWALVDAFSAYKGRPGNYRGTKKTVNKYGFISTPEISIEKPENTIRIVFLGGSSTAGTGRNLADEDTWPFLTTEILKKNLKSRKVEFINAALGGYTTFESFGRLWSRVRFFSPDIIVVYHGWNEMYYFDRVDKIVLWRTLPDGSWGFNSAPKIATYEPHWIDNLIRYSQLLTKIRLRISKSHSEDITEVSKPKEIKAEYDRRGLEIFRTNLRLIREAAHILDAKLFVVKQATLIVDNLNEKDRNRCHYEYHGFDHDAHVDAFNQIYRIIDEEIETEDIIDVTRLSGSPEYFYDHVHPTELGSGEIAKLVAKSLQTYLVKIKKNN